MSRFGYLAAAAALSLSTLSVAMPASAAPIIVTSAETQFNNEETGFFVSPNDNRLLHAIGIYEPGGPTIGDPPFFFPIRKTLTANIVVESQASNALYLVLSSYESVNWTFSGAGASSVKGILLNGYKNSFVLGLGQDVTVIDRTGVGNFISSATYSYPTGIGSQGAGDPPSILLDFAATTFNDQVDSFIGKYSANGFLIGATQTIGGAVPEPASWAMMLLGFGLAGAAMRRGARTMVAQA
jgi:hypothetical protein